MRVAFEVKLAAGEAVHRCLVDQSKFLALVELAQFDESVLVFIF